MEEPSFQAGWHLFRCWRGPSWINTVWLLVPALRRFGYESEADRIVASCVELVERHGFREYYNPLNGEGLAARRFGWSTLLIDLLGGADGRRARAERRPVRRERARRAPLDGRRGRRRGCAQAEPPGGRGSRARRLRPAATAILNPLSRTSRLALRRLGDPSDDLAGVQVLPRVGPGEQRLEHRHPRRGDVLLEPLRVLGADRVVVRERARRCRRTPAGSPT